MSKELEAFTSSSLRGKKRGIYEQLLASLLAKVVKTDDPLTKIQAICEAAYTCRIKDKLNMKLVDVCYDVCVSFRNSKKQRRQGASYVSVSWSFENIEENYEQYIKPWYKQSGVYIPWFTPLAKSLYPEETEYHPKYGRVIHEEIQKLPSHELFFLKTTALVPQSFYALQGGFTNWSLKQLLDIQAILSDEIDPKVWSEALGQSRELEEKTSDGDTMD